MLSANFKPKRIAAASRGFLAIARLSCCLTCQFSRVIQIHKTQDDHSPGMWNSQFLWLYVTLSHGAVILIMHTSSMIENNYSSDSIIMPCNRSKNAVSKIFCYNYATKYKCCHKYKVNNKQFSLTRSFPWQFPTFGQFPDSCQMILHFRFSKKCSLCQLLGMTFTNQMPSCCPQPQHHSIRQKENSSVTYQ